MILSHTFTHSFTHFHILFTHFGLFWSILGKFNHIGCLKACAGSGKFNGDTFTHFHTLIHTLSLTPLIFFTHLGLFWSILGQFHHIGHQKACAQAGKFNGDTLTHFYSLLRTLSNTFHTLWAILVNFGPILLYWVFKSMCLSWEIQWWYFHTLLHKRSHTLHILFTHLGLFWPI